MAKWNKAHNLEYFFNTIEDGQDLAHHRTAWWAWGAKIIAWFGSFGNPKTAKKSHTSIITNVQRSPNKIEFCLLESTKKAGVHISSTRTLHKIGNQYTLTGFHSDEKLYWSLDNQINREQYKLFVEFKEAVLGKKYSSLPYLRNTYILRFVKAFIRLIAIFFKVKIVDVDLHFNDLKDMNAFYCSELNNRKDYEIGVISEDDFRNNPYPDPMSFFRNKKIVIRVK